MTTSLRVQLVGSTSRSAQKSLFAPSMFALLACLLFLNSSASAQQQADPFAQAAEAFGFAPGAFIGGQQPNSLELDDKGIINEVHGSSISMKLEKGEWVVAVGPQSKVNVAGTAEPEYLHTGLFVKFTSEFDKKGTVSKEIEQLEIIAPPKKGAGGIYEANAAEDAPPVKAPMDHTAYEFRGRVTSYKGGELTVMAGNKKIIAKTAPGVTVAVNTSDVELAQPGDEVIVTGWYSSEHKPSFENSTPGYAAVNTLSIKLGKPLTAVKKTRPVAAAKKAPAKSAAPAANPTATSRNPFDN